MEDKNGNVVLENNSESWAAMSESTAYYMTELLKGVVNNGNAGGAKFGNMPVAGKTGTSTDTITEAETGKKEYMVSFVGFAPANDPEIAVLVILDNPSSESGIYPSGGVMAAPVVGNIMYDVLPYLGVEPDLGIDGESGVYEVK